MKTTSHARPQDVFCLKASLSTRFAGLHTHSIHELFYCAGSQGWQRLEGKEIPMRHGDVFFFPAGHQHIGAALPEKPCEALVINFAETLFDPATPGDADACQVIRHLCRRADAGNYDVPLTAEQNQKIKKLFTQCLHIHETKEPAYLMEEKATLMHLFLTILRDPHHARNLQKSILPSGPEERIADVLAFVHSHYMNRIGIEDAANVAHMSRSHFHAIFRHHTGTTFMSYLNDVRVRHAMHQLVTTHDPIAFIAENCGFPCLSHFYQIFGSIAGASPASFRLHGNNTP